MIWVTHLPIFIIIGRDLESGRLLKFHVNPAIKIFAKYLVLMTDVK